MKIKEIVHIEDLENIKKAGVYKISYNNSDRIYIGSTTGSFYSRWIGHVWDLKNNCHKNQKITNVVNKYGLRSLKFRIIEVVDDEDKILSREQYYIDLNDSYNKGLNCSPSAYNSFGCKRSEDSLKKYFYNIVSQYSPEGKYIATYKSLKDASKKTGTDYITLSNACTGKTRFANGFQWKKGDFKENIDPAKRKGETTIYQYNLNGVFLKEWKSIKEISTFFNRPQNSFSTAISRGREIENCYWYKEKINEFKPFQKKITGIQIEQLDEKLNLVKTWDSIRQISKFFNCSYSNIRLNINTNKLINGFLWKTKK